MNEAVKQGFIVGMSRGGTTWMMKALNSDPRIECFGESLCWGRQYLRPKNGAHYSTEELAKLKRIWSRKRLEVCGSAPTDGRHVDHQWWQDFLSEVVWPESGSPGAMYGALTKSIHARFGSEWIIEKTPHHLLFSERILQQLPDARFILMRREAYAFMRSYKHQGDRKEEGAKRYFHKLYHPMVCALIWKRYAKASDDLRHSHPERVIELSVDDPDFAPQAAIAKVYKFLELSLIERPAVDSERNSSFAGGSKPALEKIDIFWMNLIAGRYLRQKEMHFRESNVSFGEVVGSVARLVPWGWFCFTEVFARIQGSKFGYLKKWLFQK